MRLERRQMMLGAAAALVLGLTAWTLWPEGTPVATRQTQARPRGGRASATVQQGPVDGVKLEALTASRDQPGDARRNPFQFQQRAAPPPRVGPPPAVEAPPKPVISAPTGPPPPAPPPTIPLKFVGVLERANGVKWAVLTDGKSPVPLYGREGDIIDGRYLIVKIGAESIDLTHTDGRGRQVIRLTGQ